ncbi:hypothetical protein L7F22_067702 [Adiantum nelumboides]|nr:hypothetical protein [Adiantum nelumboides]
MDPETEKHFAALIMEEAARLRLQAEKEGVHAYLAKPKVRGKPNPQFLKATVRSIAQGNSLQTFYVLESAEKVAIACLHVGVCTVHFASLA